MNEPAAVVLVSGGLDSATVAYHAKAQGRRIYAMTFEYGQRHDIETIAARRVAEAVGVVDHLVMSIDMRAIGGSALTADIDVPHDRDADDTDVPSTYVPARNTVFLSFALAWAEVLKANEIYIGANAVDYSGYPDCRPEYLAAYEKMANLATVAGITGESPISIQAPIVAMTKAEIIKHGVALGVDYGMTHSCYDPDAAGHACGTCDSCVLRRAGFVDAGVPDPTVYTKAAA